jgi:hypothetical protein
MEDPALIEQFLATAETYQFRLMVIKGFFYVCAVGLCLTVLALLLEDFFDHQ